MRTKKTIRTVCLILIAAVTVVLSSPAGADPPERFEVNGWFAFPDDENQFIVFVNIDRDSRCTPEWVAFEQALVDWLDGGQVGPPPPEPEFPEGFDPFQVKRPDVGTGEGLGLLKGDDVYVDLWYWDDPADRGGVGPCLDSDDRAERFAAGTGDWSFKAIETGATVFDLALRRGDVVDANGQLHRYQLHIHDNLTCFEHAQSQNACLVLNFKLQPGN